MAGKRMGDCSGLIWGVICAAMLMGIRPLSLVNEWSFHAEPGWWPSQAAWIAPHVMLVLSFIGIGRLIERDSCRASGWQMLAVAGLVSVAYVLVVLGTGWGTYLTMTPSGYRVSILGGGDTPDLRQWAMRVVFDMMPVRAIGIAACLFALARELRVRTAPSVATRPNI